MTRKILFLVHQKLNVVGLVKNLTVNVNLDNLADIKNSFNLVITNSIPQIFEKLITTDSDNQFLK